MYKSFLFITILYINIFTYFVQALQVTEIMYDPLGVDANREWFELYNNKDTDQDLSNYKFYIEGECKTKNITKNKGESILKPGDYAIVVVGNDAGLFLSDYTDFKGNLFLTGYSAGASGVLRNSTSTSSSIKDHLNVGICEPNIKTAYQFLGDSRGKGESFNIFYNNTTDDTTNNTTSNTEDNSADNKKSLLDFGSYISTPGLPSDKQNINSPNNPDLDIKEKSEIVYYNSVNPRSYTVGDMKIEVPKEIFGVAGGYTYFPARIINSKNQLLESNTIWSFGDGIELATVTPEYIYKNPGQYISVVESLTKDRIYGIERIKVNISSPDLYITEVNKDFIKIFNNTNDEINIGSFIISCNYEKFKLSKHLILPAKGEYYLYNNISNFSCLKDFFDNSNLVYDINNNLIPNKNLLIELRFPNNILLTDYNYNNLKNNNLNTLSTSTNIVNNVLANFTATTTDTTTEDLIINKKSSDLEPRTQIVKEIVKVKEIEKEAVKETKIAEIPQNNINILDNNINHVNDTKDTSKNATNSPITVDKEESFFKKLLYFIYK